MQRGVRARVPSAAAASLPNALLAALVAAGSGCAAKAPVSRVCEPQPTEAALAKVGIHGAGALLPGGRGLAPMGELVEVGQNPLHFALSPDGQTLAVAEFGVDRRGVSVLNAAPGLALLAHLGEGKPGAFLRGLAFSQSGALLYAANTGADRIDVFTVPGFALQASIPVQGHWPAGLVLSPDGARVYVTLALSKEVQAYDTATGAMLSRSASGGVFPHALLLDGATLYVANEGADPGKPNRINAFDAQTLAQTASYAVGKNPAALALAGRTLLVASSDDDLIDRIDLDSGVVLQPFTLQEPQEGPAGLSGVPASSGLAISPNALAVSPDGQTLYVSAATLNAVLLLDARTGVFRGALPTGFRPTALQLSGDGETLFVATAKGRGTLPDPGLNNSAIQRGAVQRIAPIPAGAGLAQATADVARLAALPRHEFAAPDPACATQGPLPAQRGGDPALSSIKHVIFVLKENKTFDSVFGDFPGAEADPSLLEFGQPVTPNQHQLAQDYCLLDNFYAESEQSVEGHFWVTAQITTDYFERIWGGPWGGGVLAKTLPPGGVGPLDSPRQGFIWEQLSRSRVPYTSYGEFVGVGGALQPHLDLSFVDNPLNFLARPDTEKLQVFLAALSAGHLDPFTFVALQWDHTYGSRAGKPAPDYMVADNDRATGLLVEAVSRSPYWKDTLILITEDDPSGAYDHVDAHRSFALVVGPYARRGRISHVRASFPSLAATYERALGVAPVSALDGEAEPLWDCLTATPDLTQYTALAAGVGPKNNLRGAPGEEESRALDFSLPDQAQGMSAILWKAMRPGEPLPQAKAAEEDDDGR